eukprot:g7819.t1
MAEGSEEEDEDAATLHVQQLSGTKNMVRVPKTMTIRVLKTRLARICGSPPYAQMLLQGHAILEDDRIIQEICQADEAELQLICQPCKTESGHQLIECVRMGQWDDLKGVAIL